VATLLFSVSALATEPAGSPEGFPRSRELRITVQSPPGSLQNNNLELFKKRVEKDTNGALKITIPWPQLIEDSQVIKAVAAGQVEMGGSRIGHFVQAVPAIGIFLLPFMFNLVPVQEAALATDSRFRRLLDAAVLEKTGTRVLWWQPFGTFVMLSNSAPVDSPAAMAGTTVRTFDTVSEKLVRSCGGTPVYLGGSEHYDAYKAGKALIGQAGLTFVVSRRFWEVMDTLTNTRHTIDGMLILINEQVWRSLSSDQQRIVDAAAAEAQAAILADLQKAEAEAYALAAKNGMKIYEITPDQVAEWRACSAPVVETFMGHSGELGQRLLNAYGHLRTQPCCSAGVPGVFTRR
jgi:C4-dicarboxylate-binding protein DctP